MIRIVLFLALLAGAAFGVSWLLDRPGDVTVMWLGQRVETSVFVALGVVLLACVLFAILWSLFAFLFRVPTLMSLARRGRRHAKGRDAISRGMVAVGAGDLRSARRAANEAARVMPHEPMGLLLRAQVAQMEGDRTGAESAFAAMAQKDSTRLLGLRGLHVEANRRGDAEAAHGYAREAHRITPLPWAGDAIVGHHAANGQWEDALATVDGNARAKIIDAATAERQRAVLETAIAQDREFIDAEGALKLARSAARRAPDLVPAVALAARLLSRRGEFRPASKLVERAWEQGPHPDLAAAYLAVRVGDSNADRFARSTTLARRMPDHPESRLIVAEAALATRDFARAREAMAPLVSDGAKSTARMCLLMADIEETENGDSGLLREWLARASRAPRDPAWVADGVMSQRWSPVSPVTGKLDAFRWETPREELGALPREPVTAPRSLDPLVPALPTPSPEPEAHGPTDLAVTEAPVGATEPSASIFATVEPPPDRSLHDRMNFEPPAAQRPVIFPLATSPDDPGPRPSGTYSGGFRS